MIQQLIKPAVVLDDDRNWATNIARGIRRFGGLPVKYFPSIESFYRNHNIEYGDKKGLAKVIGEYSTIVCDNNFEAAGHEKPNDGWIRGADFLLGPLGTAIESMPMKKRPLVMCFAPSSQAVIMQREKEMWDKFGIVSFHKTDETVAVGLAVRIAQEYGVSLSRKSIIADICRQSLDEQPYNSPKHDFFFNLRADHTDMDGSFDGESYEQVEGDARPLPWNEIMSSMANRLNLTPDTLGKVIEQEVSFRKAEIEGQQKHPEK